MVRRIVGTDHIETLNVLFGNYRYSSIFILCFKDALQTASAQQQLLEQQVEEVMATLASLDLDHSQQGGVHDVIKVRWIGCPNCKL